MAIDPPQLFLHATQKIAKVASHLEQLFARRQTSTIAEDLDSGEWPRKPKRQAHEARGERGHQVQEVVHRLARSVTENGNDRNLQGQCRRVAQEHHLLPHIKAAKETCGDGNRLGSRASYHVMPKHCYQREQYNAAEIPLSLDLDGGWTYVRPERRGVVDTIHDSERIPGYVP